MKNHEPGRLAAVVVAVVCYVISLVFNALAVVGYGKQKKTFSKSLVNTIDYCS